MQLPLSGLWQLSPLTDLSVPQDDLTLPAALSSALPEGLPEQAISSQEWHLMHDIELEAEMLSFPAIDLVVGGIDYYAEVRVNGEAVFDCDGSQVSYRRDIKRYLREGRNRVEILFLEPEEDLLLDEESTCLLGEQQVTPRDSRVGIWQLPYLQFIRNVRLDYITTEQIWHHGGGCELKVDMFYQRYHSGLQSASLTFNGMTLQIPLDMRTSQCSAVFQVDAPLQKNSGGQSHYYLLQTELDGQKRTLQVALNPEKCAVHYPA